MLANEMGLLAKRLFILTYEAKMSLKVNRQKTKQFW